MNKWGISSAGRAPALHAGGQRFDPAILHHLFRRSLIEELRVLVFLLDFKAKSKSYFTYYCQSQLKVENRREFIFEITTTTDHCLILNKAVSAN
jgi:hypothetical protein